MSDRPFLDHTVKPTEQAVQSALGDAHACYRELVTLAGAYKHEWTFAGKSGWMLKIHDRKKALLYVIPIDKGFRASMAIREGEREAFLADPELASIHDKLASSRRFAEGFAQQFDVTGSADFGPLAVLVAKLVAIRAS